MNAQINQLATNNYEVHLSLSHLSKDLRLAAKPEPEPAPGPAPVPLTSVSVNCCPVRDG